MFLNLFFLLGIITNSSEPALLRAQDVVDRLLESSFESKELEIDAQLADVYLFEVEGAFDITASSYGLFELNRGDNLTGFQNVEDRNLRYGFGIDKAFSSGSRFGIEYERTYQTSELQAFQQGLRNSNQVFDAVRISARQNLLKNAFGIADRSRLESAQLLKKESDLLRKEGYEELILRGLGLFWRTYVAREDLRFALLARDKYASLVRSLESKVERQLAEKADLARARAELENKNREVKVWSLLYLNLTRELSTLLRMPADQAIELDVAKELPSPPAEAESRDESSRLIQAAEIRLEDSQLRRKNAKWRNLPQLDLLGAVTLTGVAENGGDSFSKVSGADRPIYEVGLELSFSPLSKAQKSARLEAELAELRALNRLGQTKSQIATLQEQALRDVQSKYLVAESAMKTFQARDAVIKEQERRYQRGLIGLLDLIQDYNFYYSAQSFQSSSIADYHLSLIQWKAAEDKLVP